MADETKELGMTDQTTAPDESDRTTQLDDGAGTGAGIGTGTGTDQLSPEPQPEPEADHRRGPSVPTIVWGLLFGLVAAVVMLAQTTEVDLDLDLTAPLALLAAGVVLVAWGVAGLGRSRRPR